VKIRGFLTKDEDVKKRWKEYFERVLKEEYPRKAVEKIPWND